MLLTKQQLRAHAFTSDDEERFALSHLKIEPDGRVFATNGHLAVLVTPKGQSRIEEADFPAIPGMEGADPKQAIYLPAETARAAAAIVPGGNGAVSNGHCRLLVDKRIVVGATDLRTPQLVMVEPPAVENFPNVGHVIRVQPKGGASISLNPAYLEQIAKYARTFGTRMIRLTVNGPTDAVRVSWEDDEHQVDMAVMPMRDDRDDVAPKKREVPTPPKDERTPDMFQSPAAPPAPSPGAPASPATPAAPEKKTTAREGVKAGTKKKARRR